MKTYRVGNKDFVGIVFIGAIFVFGIVIGYQDGEMHTILLSIISIAIVIWLFFISHYTDVIIDEEKIVKTHRNGGFHQEMRWVDVDRVVEDIPFKWFKWLYVFHLIPKAEVRGVSKRWFSIANNYNEYTELLKDIVSHVSPTTPIDDFILKISGTTKEDIGKLYKAG